MTVIVDIDMTDLVKFVQNLQQAPSVIRPAAARALNTVGDKVVDEVVAVVADQTGMADYSVRRNVSISRASPDSLVYRIDASSALIDAPAARPMRGRQFVRRPDDYFHADEMVKIVTMGDEKVCQICQDLEDEGPFRIDEARAKLPAHPHCRCVVQPYRSRRELPVSFRKGQNVDIGSMTLARLQEELGKEVKISLRAL